MARSRLSSEMSPVNNNARTTTNRIVGRVLVIGAVLLASVAGSAQTYIFGRADFTAGNFPTSIAAGDFNGDGIPDLAVANSGDDTISVLLGKANGTFAPQVTYATGSEPVAVVVGDFNGDGNLDIAVTNGNCTPAAGSGPLCSPSTVSILLGNGDGTFQPEVVYGVGTLPSSLVAADFNGDGKLDLAVTNAFDGTVSILLGNGDGTFQPQVVYATAGKSAWQSIVIGDFNGDGKLDLAVSCDSVVSVLLGNGDGTFRTHLDSGAGGISLAVGDFNGDGKLDLAVCGGGTLSVLLGNGDGTFILKVQYRGGSGVAASALSGSGTLDLLVSGPIGDSSDSVAVLSGNGDGTFQSAVYYGTSHLPFGFVVMDLNGDGKLDVAVAGSGCAIVGNPCVGEQSPPGTVSVLLGFGDGTFVGKADYATGTGPLALTSADFNNDGYLDLAVANQGGDSVSVLLGNGDGTFQSQVSYPVGHLPLSLAAGDFRNNGDTDLATANEICQNTPPCNPGTVSVLLGNGNGTFQTHVDYGVGLVPYGVAVGDFRGNGELDLVATNNESSSVSVLLGNGDGTFQPQVGYLTASGPQQVATGDFNQDGKLDLAVSVSAGVSILLGNGDGTFKTHVEYPAAGPFAIVAADFNGDGKLDLAVGGEGVVSILLGNGDGTFKAPVNYSTYVTGAVFAIAVTDFNQDGKLDLAVNTESTESVILLGNGDGTFQQPIQYLLANLISQSLTVGDFNRDGTPDWGASDSDGNTVGVMLSAGFKANSPGSLSFGSQGVGTTSASQAITLSNPSNVNIKISTIAASSEFSQTNNCPTELMPATNCVMHVTFSPTRTGLQSGAINVTDNTRISPLAIPLGGTGVNGPFLTPYPGRLNFSPEPVGASSPAQIIMLMNTGNATLNVTSIGITGANASDFSQTDNCPSSLTVGGSCNIDVTFAPSAGGTRTADLAISDTAPGSPQTVPLVGTGLGPIASLNPNQLNFPSQAVGTTSTPQVVTLANSGKATLNITQIAASGDFAETNTCSASLGPGNTCQISITFRPETTGNQPGSVTVSDNAANSPQAIVLSGAGVDFTIALASGSPTLQTVSAGQEAKFSLDVAPSGGFAGTVTLTCAIAPIVTPAPTCNLSSSSVQLTGSGSQPVTVTVGTTALTTTGILTNLDFLTGWTRLMWVGMLVGWGWLLLRNRKWWPVVSMTFAVIVLALCVACGGGSSSIHSAPGTPAGSYTATVTATMSSVNHDVKLTVLVQ